MLRYPPLTHRPPATRQGLDRRRLPAERELYAALRCFARYAGGGAEHDEMVEGLLAEQVSGVLGCREEGLEGLGRGLGRLGVLRGL